MHLHWLNIQLLQTKRNSKYFQIRKMDIQLILHLKVGNLHKLPYKVSQNANLGIFGRLIGQYRCSALSSPSKIARCAHKNVEIHSGEHKRNAKKFAGVTRSSILNARFVRVRKKGHVQGPTFKFAHGMKRATKFNFVLVNKGRKKPRMHSSKWARLCG